MAAIIIINICIYLFFSTEFKLGCKVVEAWFISYPSQSSLNHLFNAPDVSNSLHVLDLQQLDKKY